MKRRRIFVAIISIMVLAALVALSWPALAQRGSLPTEARIIPRKTTFSYGFDFAQQGPYSFTGANNRYAVTRARYVMRSIPGMLEDTAIMDWGLGSPEPVSGKFNLADIRGRVGLTVSTGGIPVITLCTAPNWMKHGAGPDIAPSVKNYQNFAILAARIAQEFPQVRYFVVWNELKGFWNASKGLWNISKYTILYNMVYRAIKKVRPSAEVGGPYIIVTPYSSPQAGNRNSTPHGKWGYLAQYVLDAIDYWLTHKAGASFIAVDGADFPKSGQVTNPLVATQMYARVDRWLRTQTRLPIWWMESHIQPPASGWSARRAAALRVAVLVRLAASGATAGLQWQPQQGEGIPDAGLWTATGTRDGGQPTYLADVLPRVLAVLSRPVTITSASPSGALVARSIKGTIMLNAGTSFVSVVVHMKRIILEPGEVSVILRSLPGQGSGKIVGS